MDNPQEVPPPPEVFTTFTGHTVDPWNLSTADIDIRDIAHSQANTCRFHGHSRVFYPLAQHSIMVSMASPLGFELDGLLHDAGETYFNDLSSLVKHADGMETYRAGELAAEKLIFWRYGMQWGQVNLKPADRYVLSLEKRVLFKPYEEGIFTPMTSEAAEEVFLHRFATLFRRRFNKAP